MPPQNPVILLHGITASVLRDEYPLEPETVWSTVLHKSWERIALHPDGLRYERQEPARVAADHPFALPYAQLIGELREELSPARDRPTPVFPFAYDWRQPLALTQQRLADFIDEVIDRTLLLRHYHQSDYARDPRVDLVGHSMGGVIIAGHLAARAEKARVGRVVSIGAPLDGSFEAALKITTGNSSLGGPERERKVSRLVPALYSLLPGFGVHAEWDPALTLFDPDAWQPSVLDTIADYIYEFGVAKRNKTDSRAHALAIFTDKLLAPAAAHRKALRALALDRCALNQSDWLAIVGVGETTRVRLQIIQKNNKPWFELTGDDRQNTFRSTAPTADRTLTGDGTVPYAGATAPFLTHDNIVCVTDREFGYWELKDRLLEGAGAGLHATLPTMNLVHRLTISFLKGQRFGKVRAHRPPDLAPDAPWNPPVPGLEEIRADD